MKASKFLLQASRIIIFCVYVATASIAQTNADTPQAVAARYSAAMRASDWATVAQLSHPEALKQLKEMFGPLVAAEPAKFGAVFFNVRSKEEYDQLSGITVLERLMRSLSKQVPEFAAAVEASEMKIVGHVKEEPDLAHVVYRMNTKVGDLSVSKTAVMTLKREGESWRALLSGSLEGLAAVLTRRESAPNKDLKPRHNLRRSSRPS